MTQALEWVAYRGAPLYDEDGNVIGSIEEFFVETDDGPPAWAVVINEAEPATRSYVPMRDARRADDGQGLQVSVDGDTVRDAPRTQADDDLSGEQERQLYEHYGQDYPDGQRSEDTDNEERKPGLLQRLFGRDSR
ncbi:PRC-barrel domain-containing protein [Actinomycetospora sp. TBRC 11914]|uniref:PRC-barrel domain-containing protein n=1 Tax=Actinomycetospora sp. TBRC 11914 TaxID=2729387 RepID=UPI00145E5B34|nr:PRC-barrel domain-containing protein [Actinomycetospora sp. TBRC 11914]NMO93054.1 PRC-barrel domain containing protein [Actinomycetospora sp. TBRC 11914]